MDNWKVLIVEDEADSADVVSRILKFHGIEHAVAKTAEEALDLLVRFDPTLLVVDLMLPGMDGLEFLKVVREDANRLDILAVAITAYHSTYVAEQALATGFSAYFAKPLEATSFVRELERIVKNGE